MDRVKSVLGPHLSYVPRSDLEWLMLAQHYGIPTRLLDFSENPLVALFFAVEGNPGDRDAAVMCLKHDRQPKTFSKLMEIQQCERIEIVYPVVVSDRVLAQDSMFTLEPFPRSSENEDDESDRWKEDDLRVFRIRANNVSAMRDQLRSFGVTREKMFPGLESTAGIALRQIEFLLAEDGRFGQSE